MEQADFNKIASLIKRLNGKPVGASFNDVWLPLAAATAFLRAYLGELMPDRVLIASGMRIVSRENVAEEHEPRAVPGETLLPFGYVVLATSVGGNAVVFSTDGAALWADRTCFATYGKVLIEDTANGIWQQFPLEANSIRNALIEISRDQVQFMISLLQGDLDEKLELLDLGEAGL